MTQTRDIFQAIADPTRRQIMGMLAGKSLNVNTIAKEFDITRQAVSLHVQFLNDCGLIRIKQQGRQRYCEAKFEKLNEVTDWVNQYRKYWDKKFDSIESYLEKIQKKKNKLMETYNTFKQENNVLIHTRILNAPRELVWEVWTNPEHLKEWWGPDGFSISTKSMTVEPGQIWDFIMHGMGRDWDNKIEYVEVKKPSLLTYKHSGERSEDYNFTVSVFFEQLEGKTLLTMKSVFKSKEIIDELNRKVNAIEGGKQTLNRLVSYVQKLIKAQNSL